MKQKPSKPPTTNSEYPFYFIDDNKLTAFTEKDRMYLISLRGSNSMCAGVCIDYYVTRNMVLKHWRYAGRLVTPEEFRFKSKKLFDSYIERMLP